jgi:hypothetical protein
MPFLNQRVLAGVLQAMLAAAAAAVGLEGWAAAAAVAHSLAWRTTCGFARHTDSRLRQLLKALIIVPMVQICATRVFDGMGVCE